MSVHKLLPKTIAVLLGVNLSTKHNVENTAVIRKVIDRISDISSAYKMQTNEVIDAL